VRRARLAAACRVLLAGAESVTVTGPGARYLAPLDTATDWECARAVVVVFLGAPARPAERQLLLDQLRGRLTPGTPVVLVDHNQPRALWRRVVGVIALGFAGFGPSRARYPAAREMAALGFRIEQLVLACGERVQLVRARVGRG